MPPFLYRCPNTGVMDVSEVIVYRIIRSPSLDVVAVPCVRASSSGEPEDRQGPGL
jgi:hypothetical protein